nr:MAG TPA: homing endonuclease [Caudoviricetes sp.]
MNDNKEELMEIGFIEDQLDGEVWKEVNILGIRKNCYMVSNKGRVYSFISNQFMKPIKKTTGYYHIKFRMEEEGLAKQIFVHRVVALTFIHNDDPDFKIQVNHKDGDKSNNAVSNLEWTTPWENDHHSVLLGLKKMSGEDNPKAVLTYEIVAKICDLYNRGMSESEIAEILKTTEKSQKERPYSKIKLNIHDVITRKYWSKFTKDLLKR